MNTATLKRTDIHRPSAINPEEYRFVAVEYVKTDHDIAACQFLAQQRAIIAADFKRTGGTYSAHEHGGGCMICGAHCIYTALFHHEPTNTYIRTGFECADKLDYHDAKLFRAVKKAVKEAREAKAGKQKAQAILHDAGLDRAWELFTLADGQPTVCKELFDAGAAVQVERFIDVSPCPNCRRAGVGHHIEVCETCRGCGYVRHEPRRQTVFETTRDYFTLCDVVRKLVKYGSISEKQLSFLRSLVDRIGNRKKIEAQREAERAAAKDCPEGRIVIRGTVISIKEYDGDFGTYSKWTVKHADGWLANGTVPRDNDEAQRGDVVEFTATLSRSDRDPKFGFYKRPTCANVVERNNDQQ